MDQWVVTGVTHLVYLLEHELLTLNHCFGRVHFDNSEPVFGRVHVDESERFYVWGCVNCCLFNKIILICLTIVQCCIVCFS